MLKIKEIPPITILRLGRRLRVRGREEPEPLRQDLHLQRAALHRESCPMLQARLQSHSGKE